MIPKRPYTPRVLILVMICGLITVGLTPSTKADNGKEAFTKAEALLQEKKYPEAIILYEEVLTRDPSLVPAYPGLIKAYAGLGDLEGGAAFIESLYLENPDNAGINYGLGYALYRQKEYNTAAGYFDRAIELDPDLAEAWNNRAVIYHFVERDYEKARPYYEKAVILAEKAGNQKVTDIAKKNLTHLPKTKKITPVTETLSLEEYLNRLVSLLEQGDKTKLQGLVLGQKENGVKAMDWLMEQAEKAQDRGDKKSEKNALTLARILADYYNKCFKSDILFTKLDAYPDDIPQQGVRNREQPRDLKK